MKQVGLNVAADSLMSSAYLGTVGGLVIISCDDPGPHSSQTEQDTRLMARLAKVPVLDPSTPQEAREMVKLALEPEWEAVFEPNSYGFRPGRNPHDAIEAVYNFIRLKPKYALKADIENIAGI